MYLITSPGLILNLDTFHEKTPFVNKISEKDYHDTSHTKTRQILKTRDVQRRIETDGPPGRSKISGIYVKPI